MAKKINKGTNLLELLLALSILSASMYPLVYIFKMAQPTPEKTQNEFLATLLCHHVAETIIANKIENPDYLPQMTDSEPVVQGSNSVQQVSEYFANLTPQNRPIEESENPRLYNHLRPFKCRVDTYYLEGMIYKSMVYISYLQDKREMKVFLERLLAQPSLIEKEDNLEE
ncbi:MAG: hypothetical protein ACQETH_02975 [Candidatus Rifleibacteriota bacterium]